MADFFTDSDDDKAVEELLSQAMDATVLEQVAAVNCAGFNDDGLPSHLQARFQKLKTFPSSAANPTPLSTKSFNLSHANDAPNQAKPPLVSSEEEKGAEKNVENQPTKCSTEVPDEKSSFSDTGSPFKEIPQRKLKKNEARSLSHSSYDGFSSRSASPPAKSGCFMCSPKKVLKKKNKENRGFDCGKSDELLSDLSNFSVRSQRRMMKKAMEEEERISREAEKIVKWAKQASARMEFSGVGDELSDDDNAKFA
ncbi:uncharacterized protein LOC125212557 [Salvia hispanica]|uniref:uncharacterized protein LOC125212557 n=1 Tax=Salvia hispanica TaxID=49212 RepID=UPI002009D79C|nr:uncharacterized protein LOC125212557 [Salvia hispanica]